MENKVKINLIEDTAIYKTESSKRATITLDSSKTYYVDEYIMLNDNSTYIQVYDEEENVIGYVDVSSKLIPDDCNIEGVDTQMAEDMLDEEDKENEKTEETNTIVVKSIKGTNEENEDNTNNIKENKSYYSTKKGTKIPSFGANVTKGCKVKIKPNVYYWKNGKEIQGWMKQTKLYVEDFNEYTCILKLNKDDNRRYELSLNQVTKVSN